MPIYKAHLLKSEQVARNTMAFHFEKPPGFTFRAGQFLELTLLNPPETDSQGKVRTFSIASAPYEEEIVIATRMRDTAFKRVLHTLPAGTEVQIDGPAGSFVLHTIPAKATVFLAGGIGITPFRSILRQANKEGLHHQFYLFYSNHRPDDAPFLKEMEELARSNPRLIFVPTMTQVQNSDSPWQGTQGRINREMLVQHFCEMRGPIYYAAGPPEMVGAMHQLLTRLDVNEDDIWLEEFSGY